MEDLNKRLVEVEYILRKLDDSYIRKIPSEIWRYIELNKDNNYIYNYNENKTLLEQNLHIDTIAILTYINIEYLLNEEQKKEMRELLRKDELFAEREKNKRYNVDNIFKNRKQNEQEDVTLVEVKNKKWYEKLISFFGNMLKK